jgi:hypothetical protein
MLVGVVRDKGQRRHCAVGWVVQRWVRIFWFALAWWWVLMGTHDRGDELIL